METFISVLVIVLATSFVLANIGFYIYKRIKGLPTGECSYCSGNSKKLIEEYRKFAKTNK